MSTVSPLHTEKFVRRTADKAEGHDLSADTGDRDLTAAPRAGMTLCVTEDWTTRSSGAMYGVSRNLHCVTGCSGETTCQFGYPVTGAAKRQTEGYIMFTQRYRTVPNLNSSSIGVMFGGSGGSLQKIEGKCSLLRARGAYRHPIYFVPQVQTTALYCEVRYSGTQPYSTHSCFPDWRSSCMNQGLKITGCSTAALPPLSCAKLLAATSSLH